MGIFGAKRPQLKPFEGIDVLKGRESDLAYLIHYGESDESGEVVVFVDVAMDLDWEIAGKMSELVQKSPLKEAFSGTLRGIASLEPIVQNWPDDLKLRSKRLLGEPLARIFRDDIEGADCALEDARKFIGAKSRQVSRYWTLWSCLIAGGTAALAGVLESICRSWVIGLVGGTAYTLSLCFWFGCVGALLFVVMRLGSTQSVDSTAERHLHFLEGVARIVGGGIAGVLVGSMVKLGLVLPLFAQAGKETLAMCAAAMIAGASERLAVGIVLKVEHSDSRKQDNQNGNH
jgi:hypothetical protein